MSVNEIVVEQAQSNNCWTSWTAFAQSFPGFLKGNQQPCLWNKSWPHGSWFLNNFITKRGNLPLRAWTLSHMLGIG